MPESVDILDVLDQFREAMLDALHTAMPGKVVSFDSSTCLARVQPMIPRIRIDALGEKTIEQLPEIPDVPIIYPRSGAASIVFPLAAGDGVLLVFSEGALGTWRATGKAVDPGDVRRHSLSHCVAFPGAFPDGSPSDQIAAGALTVAAAEVRLGSKLASDYVALTSKVDAALAMFVTVFNAHIHAGSPSPGTLTAPSGGGPVTGNTAPPTTPMVPALTVAATKVKAI